MTIDTQNTTPTGSTPNAQGKSEGRKKNLLLKSVLWVLGALLCLLLGSHLAFTQFGKRIFSYTIDEVVRLRTHGQYEIDYKNLKFNLFKSTFEITDVKFTPDSAAVFPKNRPLKVYAMDVEKLTLEGIHLLKIIRKKEINIANFRLEKPHIFLHSYDSILKQSTPDSTAITRSINLIDLVNINNLEIIDAQVSATHFSHTDTIKWDFDAISLHLHALALKNSKDSITSQLFNKESQILIGKNRFDDPNGRFSIAFEAFNYLGGSDDIVIKKCDLQIFDSTKQEKVRLFFPELQLNKMMFNQLIFKRQLNLQEISFLNPELFIHQKPQETKHKLSPLLLPETFNDLVNGRLTSMLCKTLQINDARVVLISPENDSLKVQNISINLKDIAADSASWEKQKSTLFTENITLKLGKQSISSSTGKENIQFNKLQFDLTKGDLVVDNLLFTGAQEGTPLVVKTEQFALNFTDIFHYLFTLELHLNSLKISKGSVETHIVSSANKSKKSLYATLNSVALGFCTSLTIDTLDIELQKAIIASNNKTVIQLKNSQINAVDIQLPSTSKSQYSRPFNALQLELRGEQIRYTTETKSTLFEGNNFNILAKKRGAITLGSAYFSQAHAEDSVTVDLKSLICQQIDFGKLIRKKRLDIGSIELTNPKVALSKTLTSKPKKRDSSTLILLPMPLSLDCFRLNQGELNLSLTDTARSSEVKIESFSIELEGFDSEDTLFYGGKFQGALANIRLGSRAHSLRFSDSQNIIALEDLILSSEDSLFTLTDLHLHIEKSGENITLDLPRFLLKKFDINQLLTHRNLYASETLFEHPTISAQVVIQRKDSLTASPYVHKKRGEKWWSIISQLGLKNSAITSAELNLDIIVDGKTQKLETKDFHFSIENLEFDTYNEEFDLNKLSRQDIFIHGNNYQLYLLDSLYSLTFDTIELGTKPSLFSIKNLSFQPTASGKAHNKQSEFSFEEVAFNGIDWPQLLIDKKLQIALLEIKKPKIHLALPDSIHTAQRDQTLPFSKLHLDSLDIRSGAVDILNFKGEDYALDIDYFTASHLAIDSTLFHKKEVNPFDYVEQISVKTGGMNLPLSRMMGLKFNGLELSTKQQSITLDSLCVIPRYSKREFAKILGYQMDWTQLKTAQIELQAVEFERYFEEHRIAIGGVAIHGMTIEDFRDKHLPMREDFFPAMPMEMISKIPIPVTVDTLSFHNAFVTYQELGLHVDYPGIVFLDSLDVQVLSICNDKKSPLYGQDMKLEAHGRLMGDGKFNFYTRFIANDSIQKFRSSGGLSNMDLTLLDTIIEPLGLIDIRSGYVEFVSFQWIGDVHSASGGMTMNYDNLKIGLIDAKKLRPDVGDNILAFLANTFVVRKKNPSWLFPRKGSIYFERDPQKSIYNYWVKSLLMGTKSSVGLGDNKPKKEEKKRRKEDRKKRKEARRGIK